MLNQTKYNSITVLQSSITEQSVMVYCPDRAEKTAIVQSYSTDRADELLAAHSSQIDRLIPLDHPNIQSIIEVFVEEHNLHLVTGAVQGKRAATQVPLSAERCEKLLQDILPVLSYLHDRGITHGNISPDTILFQAQNQPVLTDFQAITELKIAAGGEVYPQIDRQLREISVTNIPNGQQFDLYSLGVTTIYLLSNRELKHLYDPTTQKWQWENHLGSSSGKLLRAIDRLLNRPTSAAEVLQEFQIQSRVILDAPIPIQDTIDRQSSIYPPTQMSPTSTSDRTTTVLPPPTNFQTNPTNIPSSSTENKSLKTLLIGGIGGALLLFVGMSIGSQTSKSPEPISQTSVQVSPTPSQPSPIPDPSTSARKDPPQPSPSPDPSTSARKDPPQPFPSPIDFTRNDASNLISQWLEVKKSVFGSSYSKSASEALITGLAYQRNITDNSGTEESSVDDLVKNGMYYTYGNQQVHQIADIRSIDTDEVKVIAIVSEQRTLHNKQTGSTRDSYTNRATSCYQFKKVGDRWKISKTPELFKSCS
jgi:serine/threonine protein kinase